MLCDRSLSFFHSFSVNRITDERGNGRRQTWHGHARGDPLEVVDFWCMVMRMCRVRVDSGFSFSSPLRNRPRRFSDIC